MTTHPEDYAAIEGASAPAFTSDGRSLLFLRGGGLSQICPLALDSGGQRQLTRHDEKVALLRRCPVDDHVIYGIDRGGDERQQLWLLDASKIAGAACADRQSGGDPRLGRLGAGRHAASPMPRTSATRRVRRLSCRTSPPATAALSCSGAAASSASPAFVRDGAALALLHDRGYGDMSLLVLDLASGEARPFPQPRGCNYQSVRWASDGRTLLALTDHGDSDFLRLCRLDPDSGAVTVVYAAPGRDVEAWALSPDGGTLATVENDRGYAILRVGAFDHIRAPAAGGASRCGGRAWPACPAAWSPSRRSRPTERAWRSPSRRRRCPPRSGSGRTARQSRCGSLNRWSIPPASSIASWWNGRASTARASRAGWRCRTARQPPRGRPAVVWVHGGPVAQTRANFRPDMQMLLACGVAVLMPNVRGSSGYGRAFAESDDGAKRLDSVADLAAGQRFLAAHPAIDPQRIGIMGQSYGGFMVLSAITEYPRPLARGGRIITASPISSPRSPAPAAWRRSHRAAEYGDPQRDAALFERISPIHRIDRVRCRCWWRTAAATLGCRSARANRSSRPCANGSSR